MPATTGTRSVAPHAHDNPAPTSVGHSTRRSSVLPRPGDLLLITRSASVQFTRPLLFRLIRVDDGCGYTGWKWLEGYELDEHGEAVRRRSIFVQTAGLERVTRSDRPPAAVAKPGRYPLSPATTRARSDRCGN